LADAAAREVERPTAARPLYQGVIMSATLPAPYQQRLDRADVRRVRGIALECSAALETFSRRDIGDNSGEAMRDRDLFRETVTQLAALGLASPALKNLAHPAYGVSGMVPDKHLCAQAKKDLQLLHDVAALPGRTRKSRRSHARGLTLKQQALFDSWVEHHGRVSAAADETGTLRQVADRQIKAAIKKLRALGAEVPHFGPVKKSHKRTRILLSADVADPAGPAVPRRPRHKRPIEQDDD
jgi:hypothetical protein